MRGCGGWVLFDYGKVEIKTIKEFQTAGTKFKESKSERMDQNEEYTFPTEEIEKKVYDVRPEWGGLTWKDYGEVFEGPAFRGGERGQPPEQHLREGAHHPPPAECELQIHE